MNSEATAKKAMDEKVGIDGVIVHRTPYGI